MPAEKLSADRLARLVIYGKQLQIVRAAAEKAGISEDLNATEYIEAYVAHAERLSRGEFICQKCGIRKDGEHDEQAGG